MSQKRTYLDNSGIVQHDKQAQEAKFRHDGGDQRTLSRSKRAG